MPVELSDEEVFGAQRELSDAEVFGGAPGEELSDTIPQVASESIPRPFTPDELANRRAGYIPPYIARPDVGPVINPAHSDAWNRDQLGMVDEASRAGLPQTYDARKRLMDAIHRTETAGFESPHFIGRPKEPTGDRGVTRDIEELVAGLKARELTTPAGKQRDAIAAERAYWENEVREGMSAKQWLEQTGEQEPRYPHELPAELQQFEEQAAIERNEGNYNVPEWLRDVVPQAIKLPAKLAIAGGAMQTGRLHWPTDEEVETPLLSPEVSRGILAVSSGGLTEIARDARTRFPENKIAQVASGVTEGVTDAVSGFSTPENLALLPIAPGGKLAQRAIAGVFLGQAISGTPEQWEAFNNAPELADKIRIATSMGLGYALPALGAAHSFRKPKVVEPVRTTREAQDATQADTIAAPEIPSRESSQPVAARPPESILLRTETPFVEQAPRVSQKEMLSPAVEEARPKQDLREIVSEAAFRDKEGRVFSGFNHSEAMVKMYQETGRASPDAESGFVTSAGRFVSSKEASEIARSRGQLSVDESLKGVRSENIRSEPIGVEAALAEIQRRNAPELLGKQEASAVPVEPTRQNELHAELKQATDSLSAMARISENVPEIEMPLTIVEKFKEQYRGKVFPKEQKFIYWSESRPPSQVSGYDRSFPVEYDARSGWIIRDKPYSTQEIQGKGLLPFSEEAKEHLLNSTAKPGARIVFADGTSALISENTRNPDNPVRVTLFDQKGNPTGHLEGKTPFAKLGYNYGNKLTQVNSIEGAVKSSSPKREVETLAPSARALPSEKQPESLPTSTKNATTFAEREKLGLPEAEQAARRDFGTVWDEAEAIAKNDREAPRRLAQEIAENPRALTDKENALLLRRQIEVQNEHSAAIDALNAAPDDPSLVKRLEEARKNLQTVYDAANSSGTETARGLNARKMLANQDFSLAKMEAETRAVVNDGRPLSPSQIAKVKKEYADITRTREALEAYQARELISTDLVQAKREAKTKGFSPVSFLEKHEALAEARIISRRGKLFSDPLGVQSIAGLADEAIIGAAHIARGVRNFGEWSQIMLGKFGERIKPFLRSLFAEANRLHTEAAKVSRLTPEQREANALAGEKKAIVTRTQKLIARTDAGDFEPVPKKPPRMDKEKRDLLFNYQRAKEKRAEGLEEAILAKRTSGQKIRGSIREMTDLSRAILTSFDFPPIFRQGGFIVLGRSPLKTAKVLPDTFRAMFSEREQFRVNEEIRSRPNAPNYLRDKLALTEFAPNTRLSRMEENIASRWLRKMPNWTVIAPIIRASGRGYTTLLNLLRADAYDNMTRAIPDMTPVEGKHIAAAINDATGRSHLGRAEKSATWLNSFLFAPRLMVSRFRMATLAPLRGGTLRSKKAVAGMYGRTLIGLSTVYGLGILAGGKVELDPRSSDFGKLRFRNTRLDVLMGLSQATVLMARLATGEKKDAKGKIVPIRETWRPLNAFRDRPAGGKVKYGQGALMTMVNFLRSKLSPATGNTINALTGEDFKGDPVTPEAAAVAMVTPISFGDIVDAMEEQGMERGAALSFVSMWGMSMQTYEAGKKKTPQRPKTLNEAMAELRQGKIKEFLTGR